MEETGKYTFDQFCEIITKLRAPDGCPWDREQTHDSLRPCMTEEAAELLAAIRIYDRTGDAGNLEEELGDVLLQVGMHSCIAEEEGLFTIRDVIDGVCRKMVRRHPHVFGGKSADHAKEALDTWDEIKNREKKTQSWVSSELRDVPLELPALSRAQKVLKKADRLYGLPSWEATLQELDGMLKRLSESGPEEAGAMIGRMLLAVSNLSRIGSLPQEQLLQDQVDRLIDSLEPQEPAGVKTT